MTDEYSKTKEKRFGERGDINYQKETRKTNLETMEEVEVETKVPFCNCGRPIMTDVGDVARCVECNQVACASCAITWGRYQYCPVCIRRAYSLDKHTYLALVFIERGLITADDLLDVTVDSAGEVFDVEIDAAAGAMLDHHYLTDAGGLSANGKEALHLGQEVFGQDGDVQAVLDRIRLQEVVDR